MLSKLKMQLGVLWSTRMKIEILDSAQDLEFLSLAVLLAANLFKGIIYPTSWSIQKDHISYIHYASWLKDHLWGILHLGSWTNSLSDFEDFLTAPTSIISINNRKLNFQKNVVFTTFVAPSISANVLEICDWRTNKQTYILATMVALVLCRISTFLGYNHNQPSSLSMWNMFW